MAGISNGTLPKLTLESDGVSKAKKICCGIQHKNVFNESNIARATANGLSKNSSLCVASISFELKEDTIRNVFLLLTSFKSINKFRDALI